MSALVLDTAKGADLGSTPHGLVVDLTLEQADATPPAQVEAAPVAESVSDPRTEEGPA